MAHVPQRQHGRADVAAKPVEPARRRLSVLREARLGMNVLTDAAGWRPGRLEPEGFPTMSDLVSGLPHYGPHAQVIGLAVPVAAVVTLAVMAFRGSRHRGGQQRNRGRGDHSIHRYRQ